MPQQFNFKDSLLFEDEDIILINKPAGISSLDERDTSLPSVVRSAKLYLHDAQLCHRLDKETSGILALAKNPETYRELSGKFESRQVKKIYHAVAEGTWTCNDQHVSLPISVTKKGIARIDKLKGKQSETIFSTITLFRDFTLLECQPVTGRLHQIRIHLASQHFPISGDLEYGGHIPKLSAFKRKYKVSDSDEERGMINRVALHAYQIQFEVKAKKYDVIASYPKDFEILLKLIRRYDS